MAPATARLDWIEPLKALAIAGILLNHLVEAFGPSAWFTNPADRWPDLGTRLRDFFPDGSSPLVDAIRFAGWLGDAGPGVFILLSGFGLMWGALGRQTPEPPGSFWRRRLWRLMPLYVAAHFAILGLAVLIPASDISFADPETLLSLLGLRFTSGLFFHISPSWWFVWLILQLYLVFPLLERLLRRWGPGRFMALAVAVTLVSRAVGIWGPVPRYYWLTGLFAGSRLAEFTSGMAAAWLLRAGRVREPAGTSALAVGIPLYGLGLVASLFLPGVLLSNLLVTVGLCALFYATWRLVLARVGALSRGTLWLGAVSFPLFLIHQPPLRWTRTLLGDTPAGVVVALAVIALCLPASLALERLVDRLVERTRHASRVRRPWPGGVLAPAFLVTAGIGLLDGVAYAGAVARATAWLLAASLSIPALRVLREGQTAIRGWSGAATIYALAAGAAALFALPPGYGIIGVVAGLGASAASLLPRPVALAARLVVSGAAAVLAVAVTESLLSRWHPLETAVWGELPALEAHATRGYALRANLTMRLRYNDYDYVMRTNSLGLPGPEPLPRREDALRILVTGDAFTMPEGVPYGQSYPALLQSRLQRCLAPRAVEVINAGVTGYGPNEELAQLRELVPRLSPDVVLIEWFANELEEVWYDPVARRAAIGLDASSASRRVRLVRRSQIRARADRGRAWALEHLTGRSSPRRVALSLVRYFDGDSPLYADSTRRALADTLEQMRRIVDGGGARAGLVLVPPALSASLPGELDYVPLEWSAGRRPTIDLHRPLAVLDSIAHDRGVETLDLTRALREYPRRPVYQRRAWHWTELGHAAASTAVAEWLVTLHVVPESCAP